MQHITVCSSSDAGSQQLETTVAINRLTPLSLISLITAYKGKNFGISSLGKAIKDFRAFTTAIKKNTNVKLFVDSGGFSIIAGEVPPHLINRCIETYHYALEHSQDAFDYIFSLDIPFNAKHPSFNTRAKIEGFNRHSLQESIKVLKKHPELKEKFLFIYHFKTPEHYEIWQNLYSELDLGKYIKHRAIGGMVSLKQKAGIDFAPFIATAYQCLNDYIKSTIYGQEFRLHFLGINVKYDRFVIAFIEKLFQRYLGEEIPVNFTYDTINYRVSGFHVKKVYDLVNGKLLTYKLGEIPDQLLLKIYSDQTFANRMKEEIITKISTGKFKNSAEVPPLKIYSELAIDTFFEEQIQQHNLIEITMQSTNPIAFRSNIKGPVNQIFSAYEDIFGRNTEKSVLKSLNMLQHFHDWYVNMREDEAELDTLSRNFISQIRLGRMIDDPAPK